MLSGWNWSLSSTLPKSAQSNFQEGRNARERWSIGKKFQLWLMHLAETPAHHQIYTSVQLSAHCWWHTLSSKCWALQCFIEPYRSKKWPQPAHMNSAEVDQIMPQTNLHHVYTSFFLSVKMRWAGLCENCATVGIQNQLLCKYLTNPDSLIRAESSSTLPFVKLKLCLHS